LRKKFAKEEMCKCRPLTTSIKNAKGVVFTKRRNTQMQQQLYLRVKNMKNEQRT